MSQEVTVYNPRKFERDRARVNSGFWPKLRRVARRLPFMGELLAAYYATLDPYLTPKTRDALTQATSQQEWNTFLLSSPDFNYR